MNILKSMKDTKQWQPTKVSLKLPFQIKTWPGFIKKQWTDGINKVKKMVY